MRYLLLWAPYPRQTHTWSIALLPLTPLNPITPHLPLHRTCLKIPLNSAHSPAWLTTHAIPLLSISWTRLSPLRPLLSPRTTSLWLSLTYLIPSISRLLMSSSHDPHALWSLRSHAASYAQI